MVKAFRSRVDLSFSCVARRLARDARGCFRKHFVWCAFWQGQVHRDSTVACLSGGISVKIEAQNQNTPAGMGGRKFWK